MRTCSYKIVLRFLYYSLFITCTICTLPEPSRKEENNGCSAMKIAYGSLKGFSPVDVPQKMTWGKNASSNIVGLLKSKQVLVFKLV